MAREAVGMFIAQLLICIKCQVLILKCVRLRRQFKKNAWMQEAAAARVEGALACLFEGNCAKGMGSAASSVALPGPFEYITRIITNPDLLYEPRGQVRDKLTKSHAGQSR